MKTRKILLCSAKGNYTEDAQGVSPLGFYRPMVKKRLEWEDGRVSWEPVERGEGIEEVEEIERLVSVG